MKQILAKPIQLSDQVVKAADEASSFKQECAEVKAKTEKLAGLLRQAARASSDLYERPTRRIIDDTEQMLDKAFSLVLKCRGNGIMKRVFTIIPAAAFRKMSAQLENSISDVSWLLRVSAPAEDHGEADFLSPPTSPSSALSGSILLFSKLDPLKTALMLPLLSFLLPVIAIATLVQRGIGPRREK